MTEFKVYNFDETSEIQSAACIVNSVLDESFGCYKYTIVAEELSI